MNEPLHTGLPKARILNNGKGDRNRTAKWDTYRREVDRIFKRGKKGKK